jgi:hypothetical protein
MSLNVCLFISDFIAVVRVARKSRKFGHLRGKTLHTSPISSIPLFFLHTKTFLILHKKIVENVDREVYRVRCLAEKEFFLEIERILT